MTDFEQRLTWIFGSPRTGSTWLLRMLIYPWKLRRDELGFGKPRGYSGTASYPSVLPVNESHLPHHLSRLVLFAGMTAAIDQAAIEKGKDLPSIFNPKRADSAAYFFSRHYEEAWRPAARELVFARFKAHAKRAEDELSVTDPAVLIKEPNGSFAADLVLELLPRSRMVFLIRDGRDVIDSQLALHEPGGRHAPKRLMRTDDERKDLVTLLAERWVSSMRVCAKAYERLPPDQKTTVRYESLLSEPAETLRDLFRFLGIPRSEDEIAEAVAAEDFSAIPESRRGISTGKRAATPALWRENLDAREQETIADIAGPTLRELGYEA